MLLKWIECQVKEENKQTFSIAQEQWMKISTVNGLILQIGGWHKEKEDNNLVACILALWRDQEAYDSFMKNEHDVVADNNNQETTYETLSTALLDLEFEIPGTYDFKDAIQPNGMLRVAICDLYDNREKHFIQMQHNLWNPSMRDANMHFGYFCKHKFEQNRFQVMTLWNNEDHEKYTKTTLSSLRDKAAISSDIKSIKGRLVLLDSNWTVIPKKMFPTGT